MVNLLRRDELEAEGFCLSRFGCCLRLMIGSRKRPEDPMDRLSVSRKECREAELGSSDDSG